MVIGVIGGGLMGLATAYILSQPDIRVIVFEKAKEAGGLSSSEELLPGWRWDRFYHVILPTDEDLLQFLREIGLSQEVTFKETKTGFFTGGQLHSMSSTMEFLKFKPISLWNKIRLGVGIYYTARLENSHRLESILAQTWLRKIFGPENYDKLWEPLLRSKLGTASSRISASFIWAYIHRLYGTRRKSSKKELLGSVRGGYHSILTRLEERIVQKEGKILVGHEVRKITALSDGKIQVSCCGGKDFHCDKVISTVPNPQIISFWPDAPGEYKAHLEKVVYLKLICATLVIKKSLSPFYVINLTDSAFPFTGIIGANHILPHPLPNGGGLIYLPRYMPPNDPFYEKSEGEIKGDFLGGLKRVFPTFSAEDVIGWSMHKELYVQPIQELNYSAKIPLMETPLKNFSIVNTTMIQDSSLNNNQVVRLARKAAKFVLQ